MALAEQSKGGSTTPYFSGRMTNSNGSRQEIWVDPSTGTTFNVDMGPNSRENRYDTVGYGQSGMAPSLPPLPPAAAPSPSYGTGYAPAPAPSYGTGYAPAPAPSYNAPAIAPAPPMIVKSPSAQSDAVRQWNSMFGGDNAYTPNQSFGGGSASPALKQPAMAPIPKPAAPAMPNIPKPAAPQGIPLITPDNQVFGVLTTNQQGQSVVKRLPTGAPNRWNG